MIAWMRTLKVILTSRTLKQKMTFGESDSLNISITGTKQLSALNDRFTIDIDNLTYKEVVQIITGKFYDIEIWAGYKSASSNMIFKGEVMYVWNKPNTDRTTTVKILAASKLVAQFGQKRLNIGMQSGINAWSMLKFVTSRAGIQNSYIDETFKHKILTESTNESKTVASIIDSFCNSEAYLVQSDSAEGNVLSIWDASRKDLRAMTLTSDNIILTNGYPRMTSDGLSLTVMPTFNFKIGDTIALDNSLIDISGSSAEDISKNLAYKLDENGQYIIWQLDYSLQNRNSDFSINILAKAKSLYKKIGLNVYQEGE